MMKADFKAILEKHVDKNQGDVLYEHIIECRTEAVLDAMKEVWNMAVNSCADSIIDDQADLSGQSIESVYKNWIK